MKMSKLICYFAVAALAITAVISPVSAATRTEMETEARQSLELLYSTTPAAKGLGQSAKGVLVFPAITKGGFIVGGQYGEGVLFQNGKATGYYNTAAASFGLQAGVQTFGYAMFLMDDDALKYLRNSEGWEIGAGPTVTIVDKGMATSLSTTTARKDVYAFFFEQRGLMAGLGLQGTKITRMNPNS